MSQYKGVPGQRTEKRQHSVWSCENFRSSSVVWVLILQFYEYFTEKIIISSIVIIANVLNMFRGSERILIFRTLKFFQAAQVTYSAI